MISLIWFYKELHKHGYNKMDKNNSDLWIKFYSMDMI